MSIIGIGTDIIECLRVAKMIERHGEIFLTRVYTPHEIEYCTARKAATQHYAGRFAAKEAVSKAFGTGLGPQLGWLDIDIRRKASGEPFVVLHGTGAATARRLGISEVRLTMSHSEHYAVAHALALGADPESAGART